MIRGSCLGFGVVALAALVGCATEARRIVVGNEPAVMWEERASPSSQPKPQPMSRDEARNIALSHDAGHTCEVTARALRAKDRQRGWAVMEHCILRPDFTDLEGMLAPPWSDDLAAHPDTPALIGHVIAVRGGDVQNDLRLVRRAKVPLFSLKGALGNPESYKGRLVVMRGEHTHSGMRAIELAETRVWAESEWVPAGPRVSSSATTDQRDASSGTPRNGLSERFSRNEGNKVEVLHNVSHETGLIVLASVDGDAPFLEEGTDYVLILRFEGTRETVDGTMTVERPVATVIDYFEPENGMFARFGR